MSSVQSSVGRYASEENICKAAILKYGNDAQMKMLLEEMSELQKEVCKHWRGNHNEDQIAEEVADVEIMLKQVKMMFGIESTVEEYKKSKLNRLLERIRR